MLNECVDIIGLLYLDYFPFLCILISLIKLIFQLKFSTDKKQAKDMGGVGARIASCSVL